MFACVLWQMLIASADQKKRSRKSESGYEEIMGDRVAGKNRSHVEVAARALYKWLKKPSPFRDLLAILSDSGSFFCASTHARSGAGAVAYRLRPDDDSRKGITEDEFVAASQVHQCD